MGYERQRMLVSVLLVLQKYLWVGPVAHLDRASVS